MYRYYQLVAYTTLKSKNPETESDYTFESTIRYADTLAELLKKDLISPMYYSKVTYRLWEDSQIIEEVQIFPK
jgi:hypothetical protein